MILRDWTAADRDWILRAHHSHYVDRLGFAADFMDAVGAVLDAAAAQPDAVGRICLHEGQRVGCGFRVADGAHATRLKLIYLDPVARGRGLGRRLVTDLLADARSELRVSTFAEHHEACALYARLEFIETGRSSVMAFGAARDRVDFSRTLPQVP